MPAELETTFTFRNMDSTEALRELAVDKLDRVQKYLVRQNASAHFIFKVEGARHTAEVAVHIKGHKYFGEETSNDMYTSLDGAIHRLEAQMSRHKERITGHKGE